MSVCPTCGQRQRTAVDRRASRQAKTSDFDTGRCRACQTPILVGWLGGTLAALDLARAAEPPRWLDVALVAAWWPCMALAVAVGLLSDGDREC